MAMFFLGPDEPPATVDDVTLLVWGGAISLAAAILTTALTTLISVVRDVFARKRKINDDGRVLARDLVSPVQELRDATVGRVPAEGEMSYNLDPHELQKVRAAAQLIPKKSVRVTVADGFNLAGGGLRGAAPALGEVAYLLERTVIGHAYNVLTHYVRADRIPRASVRYVKKMKKAVDADFKAAEKRGEVWSI